ncbi:hypothetical protein MnTg02_02956 [bacterium MnTg02]|nr:hypothetical protein MnTg02_02956 [bacterium MnTg02]
MGRVDGNRRQNGKNLVKEMVFEPFSFRTAQLLGLDDTKSMFCHLGL